MLLGLGLVLIGAGVLWIAGVRAACLWFLPEIWFWRTVAGIELSPTYRKTSAAIAIASGAGVLAADALVRSGRLF